MDLSDRVIDWFFGSWALLIWSLIWGAFLVTELIVDGTSDPPAIVAAAVPFTIFFSLLVINIGLLTGFWGAPRQTFFRYLTAVRFSLPLLIGWVGFLTLDLTSGSDRVSQAFYETVAQVIPVIALVLAVEGRFYVAAHGKWPVRAVFGMLLAFLAMGAGELIALHAVAVESSNRYDMPFVGATLITGFVSILLLVLLGPATSAQVAGE
jgi:hypothetical protein